MNLKHAQNILKVQVNASEEDLKQAYRRLASKYHPDHEPDETKKKSLEGAFKIIKEAYETCLAGVMTNQDSKFSSVFQDFGNSSYHDSKPEGFKSYVKEHHLTVTLREAFRGCTKDLKIQTPSFPIIAKVTVRPGARHNECIQTFESGGGDKIKIILSVVSDYILNQESGDLKIEVNVSALRMIIGGFVTIPTIDGEQVQVRIPAGLEPGKRLKVKDQGYWRDSSCKSRGDLIIKILPKIQELKDIPPSLLKEFKEAC